MDGMLGLLVYLVGFGPVGWQEQDAYEAVAAANEAFAEGRYEEALVGYEAAAETLGDSPELDYNRAAAHYKLGQYEPAANLLAKAALSPDPDLSQRARFNWGNCDYGSALAELTPVLPSPTPGAGGVVPPAGGQPDLEKATGKLDSAIRHYRRALETGGPAGPDDPTDRAARENIERAQRLTDLLEELKQQRQQQQQQQNQDQQNQDDQQQQQQEQDQQEDQQQDDNQQQQDEQDQQEQDQPQPDQSQEGEDQQQEREMTPQEAEAVLQAVRDREKERREEKARRISRRRVPVVKDW